MTNGLLTKSNSYRNILLYMSNNEPISTRDCPSYSGI